MTERSLEDAKVRVAKRAAQELRAGQVVNLGVGIPTLIPEYVAPGTEVFLHSENGIVGMGPMAAPDEVDVDLTNAGAQPVTSVEGASYFDIITSGAMMRGGHLDLVFMGAYEVDVRGNLANWLISPKVIKGGIGGAMDLAVGARRLIVLMTHDTAEGKSRVVSECTLPLTAMGVVDRIITDLGVIDVTDDGLVVRELLAGVTIDEIVARTDAPLRIDLVDAN